MSKASEFSEAIKEAYEKGPKRLVIDRGGALDMLTAEVTQDGEANIEVNAMLTAVEAYRLGKWLIENFHDLEVFKAYKEITPSTNSEH